MKQIKFYSFASALMLASAMGLGSCSSDSADAAGNPGVAGETVKTQFAFNIPNASTKGSRATADATQGDGNSFLGMNNIWLLAFNNEPSTNTTWNKATQLAEITNTEVTGGDSKKIYQDVAVNTGTKYFMFYGFAPTKDEVGTFEEELALNVENRLKPEDITFSLKPIHSEPLNLGQGEPYQILKALNDVNAVSWGDEKTVTDMKSQFQKMTTGSARSVKGMLQQICTYFLKPYAETKPETVAAIKDAITTNGFEIDENYNVTTKLTFPENVGLPDGAIAVKYNSQTNKFEYWDFSSNLTGIQNMNPYEITYPARLSYYVSTPIHTNTIQVASANWPTSTAYWTESTFNTNGWTTNATVDQTTVAIALAKNIHYAVASLKTQVKCNAEELDDNGDGTVKVKVPADGFKVTGFLIGNQPNDVDYEFNPITINKLDHFQKTIWDNQVDGITAKVGEFSKENYTIVLANNVSDDKQNDVNIAIELENNSGQPFKGIDGVVENGAKFYLLGTLKPATEIDAATGSVPAGIDHPSVFMKDYQTTAKFTISSLKRAYNTIPDIRTTNMQLGLSVDLQWQKGYEFNVNIGGND